MPLTPSYSRAPDPGQIHKKARRTPPMARGTIVKRGTSWRIAVELAADPITGERRRTFETTHGTKETAEKRLTELLAKADKGRLGFTPKTTLAHYLDRWLEDYAGT